MYINTCNRGGLHISLHVARLFFLRIPLIDLPRIVNAAVLAILLSY